MSQVGDLDDRRFDLRRKNIYYRAGKSVRIDKHNSDEWKNEEDEAI